MPALAEDAANFRLSLGAHHVPAFLRFLEAALDRSPSGWLAGTTGPSIADLCWAPRLRWLESGALDWLPLSILQPFPRSRELMQRVYALPAVSAFCQQQATAALQRAEREREAREARDAAAAEAGRRLALGASGSQSP